MIKKLILGLMCSCVISNTLTGVVFAMNFDQVRSRREDQIESQLIKSKNDDLSSDFYYAFKVQNRDIRKLPLDVQTRMAPSIEKTKKSHYEADRQEREIRTLHRPVYPSDINKLCKGESLDWGDVGSSRGEDPLNTDELNAIVARLKKDKPLYDELNYPSSRPSSDHLKRWFAVRVSDPTKLRDLFGLELDEGHLEKLRSGETLEIPSSRILLEEKEKSTFQFRNPPYLVTKRGKLQIPARAKKPFLYSQALFDQPILIPEPYDKMFEEE